MALPAQSSWFHILGFPSWFLSVAMKLFEVYKPKQPLQVTVHKCMLRKRSMENSDDTRMAGMTTASCFPSSADCWTHCGSSHCHCARFAKQKDILSHIHRLFVAMLAAILSNVQCWIVCQVVAYNVARHGYTTSMLTDAARDCDRAIHLIWLGESA